MHKIIGAAIIEQLQQPSLSTPLHSFKSSLARHVGIRPIPRWRSSTFPPPFIPIEQPG